MKIDFPLLLSQVVTIVLIITPIIFIVLVIFSSIRRLDRIEKQLADLVVEVKKLTTSKEPLG